MTQTSASSHAFAVLLAGGGGTRLWPKSRNKTPKQFLKLTGHETMTQLTAARLTKIVPWERIIVVTNTLYKDEIHAELPLIPEKNIIAEPEKRETALAMLVGTLFAKTLDRDAVVMNAASDHVVPNEEEYVRVMNAALTVAEKKDSLVTVGIAPTRPETGFGYIKIGAPLQKVDHGVAVFQVDSFTEKPNEAKAKEFISTGKYFWNANMYVWSADALIAAFEEHKPELMEAARQLLSLRDQAFHDALPKIYANAQSISIDYAISEKAKNLVLIPGDFGWNDVGDWKVVYDLGQKDSAGNVILSELPETHTLAINAENNLIHTNNRLIGLVGIHDMIIVDTPEILMIIPKDRSQEVKKLVERLKEEGRKEYL